MRAFPRMALTHFCAARLHSLLRGSGEIIEPLWITLMPCSRKLWNVKIESIRSIAIINISYDSAQLKDECMALGSLAVLPKLTSQAELCTLMGELIGSCDLRSHK